MKKLLIKIFIINILCLVFPIQETNAFYNQQAPKSHYYTKGERIRWSDTSNLKIYIENHPKKEIVKQGFLLWEKAIPNVHFTFTNNVFIANIRCAFKERIVSISAQGITKYQCETTDASGICYFKSPVYIDIATINPNSKKEISDEEFLKVAAHEMGHALGITRHSNDANDIMSLSTTKNTMQITNRDINTFYEVYK